MTPVQTSYSVDAAVAFAGMPVDLHPPITSAGKNTDAVSMPFGSVLALDVTSPTSDHDMVLPAASDAKLWGILHHQADFARSFSLPDGSVAGEFDTTGLRVGTLFTVARQGFLWVVCEGGCAVGDRLFVRFSGGTLGAARATDAGGGTCIDATQFGVWESVAADGAFAKLRFDFTRE